jgi:hypothetical protein
MTVPIVAAISLATCFLAYAWAREHRLRLALQMILARIFRKEKNID